MKGTIVSLIVCPWLGAAQPDSILRNTRACNRGPLYAGATLFAADTMPLVQLGVVKLAKDTNIRRQETGRSHCWNGQDILLE